MAAHQASYYQRHMAVVAAATRGRYQDMVKAMGEHDMEPVIIEDLVRFGRDEGRDEGRREGREEGRREGRDEGRREGRDEGRREVFARIIARKLGRALTRDEELALGRRISRIDDAVFDLDAAQLAAWLAADEAEPK
jgi:predicted transposase YdaD